MKVRKNRVVRQMCCRPEPPPTDSWLSRLLSVADALLSQHYLYNQKSETMTIDAVQFKMLELKSATEF